MNIEQARYNMIEQQIRPWDVLDQNVLNAFMDISRENFVPKEHINLAFADVCLPFGHNHSNLSQKMLEPKLEGRLVQSLRISKEHKVMLVGAGTGFMAALVGKLAKVVTAYEKDSIVAETARMNLQKANIENVNVVTGDGFNLDTSALFDRILLTGSVAHIPSSLFYYLETFGELIAVVGKEPIMQAVRFNAKGEKLEELFDTIAPPLEIANTEKFVF